MKKKKIREKLYPVYLITKNCCYIREITIKNFLLCSKFSVAGNSVWNDNVGLASTDLVQQRLLKETLCMRKIKFNVSRNFLENIYMTFIDRATS
jgi:hypothetical protein